MLLLEIFQGIQQLKAFFQKFSFELLRSELLRTPERIRVAILLNTNVRIDAFQPIRSRRSMILIECDFEEIASSK